MKIEEFAKYKKLIDSGETLDDDRFYQVYEWMENSGRIDEGLWRSVVSWFKRNLSPKSRRLYKLANEYENELKSEIQAEWSSITDRKDFYARVKKLSGMRMSRDLEHRMDILAEDDPDYRELVRILVNKKRLAAKRFMTEKFNKLGDTEKKKLRADIENDL
jgi:hypothetical protein